MSNSLAVHFEFSVFLILQIYGGRKTVSGRIMTAVLMTNLNYPIRIHFFDLMKLCLAPKKPAASD